MSDDAVEPRLVSLILQLRNPPPEVTSIIVMYGITINRNEAPVGVRKSLPTQVLFGLLPRCPVRQDSVPPRRRRRALVWRIAPVVIPLPIARSLTVFVRRLLPSPVSPPSPFLPPNSLGRQRVFPRGWWIRRWSDCSGGRSVSSWFGDVDDVTLPFLDWIVGEGGNSKCFDCRRRDGRSRRCLVRGSLGAPRREDVEDGALGSRR